ncbi:MAG: pyruvate phosphate dikinase, partial [Monoraphidium minutum]
GGGGAAAKVQWVLQEDEFAPGRVGCKARNLVALRRRVPDWVLVPRSVALPYGCLEAALADPVNAATAAKLRDVVAQVEAWGNGGLPGVLLREARSLVAEGLSPPAGMRAAVRAGLLSAGLVPEEGPGSCATDADPEWRALFRSVCRVWASKWNDRAWLSRRARRMHDDELQVSVLLQQVLPAHYAFVLHTASPLTGRRGEIFGELVSGLGESLVANHPGRPLSFSDRPDGSATELLTLPSKRTGLFLPGTAPYGESPAGAPPPRRLLIARSDTSGEDMEGYAGAGLYDRCARSASRRLGVS